MGDLNPNNPLKFSGGSAGGYVKRNFNGYLSLKINAMYGSISGADSTSGNQQFRNRNLSFSDRIGELSLIGEFNFLKYIPDVSQSRFTPYLYLGIGGVKYRPRANYNGQAYDLRVLTTEGETKPYPNYALTIPYGAGVKYNFSHKWTLGAELGYRNPKTDYLDDVSGLYPDRTKFTNQFSKIFSDRSGERTGVYLGNAGTQRGDLRARDTYWFASITIAYTFVTQKCYFQN